MSLFGELDELAPKPLTISQLISLGVSPSFLAASEGLLKGGRLELLTQALVEHGDASNSDEAILLLDQVVRSANVEIVRSGDFHGSRDYVNQAIRRLEATLGKKAEPKANPLVRRLGTISHMVVPVVMAGNFDVESVLPTSIAPSAQLTLFDEHTPVTQPALFSVDELVSSVAYGEVFNLDGTPRARYLARLRKSWQRLSEYLQGNEPWTRWYFTMDFGLVAQLRAQLRPFYGSYLDKVSHYGNVQAGYLELLTLLTWTLVVLHAAEQTPNPVFFVEVPVVNRSTRVTGWRLDALRVLTIDGELPNTKQLRLLREMALRRYQSAGVLLKVLEQTFGSDLRVSIDDWKFAVGDGGFTKLITEQDLQKPISGHHRQVEEYIALSDLDYSLTGTPTETVSLVDSGRLVYWLPTAGPIVREVTPDKTARQARVGHFARSWQGAKQNAQTRSSVLAMVGFVNRQVRGDHRSRVSQSVATTECLFEPEDRNLETILEAFPSAPVTA